MKGEELKRGPLTVDMAIDESWDVVVAGGGPAGCAAATAAAREGAKTLLIESTGALGGMGTSGLVPAWCPFSDCKQVIYRGLALKVFEAATKGMAHVKPGSYDWVPIDAERLKSVYDRLVTDAGVHVLFNSTMCGVEKGGDGSVKRLLVANKAGITGYGAKVFVDCSGDADIAAWAGAEFHKGDDATGEMMPVTLCFILSNVDEYAYLNGPNMWGGNKASPIYAILESKKYPGIKDIHLCQNIVGPGTVGFNAGHLWEVDNTDPESVSKAMIDGRAIARQIADALAEFHPKAFANAHLVSTAALIGARETRRIVGDYVLSAVDYAARRGFPDEIARNCYFLDLHNSAKDLEKFNKEFAVSFKHEGYKPGESHGIPYRTLTPKGLRNVLVAGRSISCDRAVQSSVRVMPVCLVMGEAAGMAAAHAAQTPGGDVRKVDVERLRKRLKEEGAYFE